MPQMSDAQPLGVKPKVYKRRFLVCIAFALNNIMNQMVWITFAPIQSRAAGYYNVSENEINTYSLVFMIAYIPGSLLCAYMFKQYGLRKSYIFCSLLQFIGTALRYIGSLSTFPNGNYEAYSIVLIGQILPSLSQPFFTNSPARIAAEWFRVDGRDIATALLSIVGVFGIGFGSFIPTIFVTNNGTNYGGFQGLMMTEFISCGVAFIFIVIFFYDKPPSAPSISQKLKLAKDQTNLQLDFKSLMSNSSFLCLFLGFGIGLGIFNALLTEINQYTAKFGYSTDNAGIFGVGLIVGGVFGAVLGGVIMETFRKYNIIIKIFTILAAITISILLYELKPDNLLVLIFLFGCVGFTAIPIIAIAFEAAAECTYPINEELSGGMLMISGQIFGVIYIVIWGEFLSKVHTYDNQNNFSTYFIVGNVYAMLLIILLYRGKYLRLAAERKIHSFLEEIDDNTTITNVTTVQTGHNALLTNPLLTNSN